MAQGFAAFAPGRRAGASSGRDAGDRADRVSAAGVMVITLVLLSWVMGGRQRCRWTAAAACRVRRRPHGPGRAQAPSARARCGQAGTFLDQPCRAEHRAPEVAQCAASWRSARTWASIQTPACVGDAGRSQPVAASSTRPGVQRHHDPTMAYATWLARPGSRARRPRRWRPILPAMPFLGGRRAVQAGTPHGCGERLVLRPDRRVPGTPDGSPPPRDRRRCMPSVQCSTMPG